MTAVAAPHATSVGPNTLPIRRRGSQQIADGAVEALTLLGRSSMQPPALTSRETESSFHPPGTREPCLVPYDGAPLPDENLKAEFSLPRDGAVQIAVE
jgi:hypothetical protein